MSQMSLTARRVSMPQTSASAMLSESARICLAKRGDGDDADYQHEGLQRAEMERPQVHAREHVLPDPTDLTAGEELDGVADHDGEPDGDQEELQRARARAPHWLPDDEIERIGDDRRQGDRDRGGRPEREPERADPEGR